MFGILKKRAAESGRIGVLLDQERIALAIVHRVAGGAPVLDRCDMLAVDPQGGTDALVSALRAAGLPKMPISVVLRTGDYQLALVEAPDVPPTELRAAMRWRLKDTLDFRVEDAVVDVFGVPGHTRGGQGRMLYAVAARREAIDRCTASLAHQPTFDVVDVPELCLRNIAASLPEAAGGVALLHLGETSVTMVLVRGSTFYFARQMELRSALARAPTSETPLDLDLEGEFDADGIVLELQRSLDYYERHFDQPPIMRVAITAGGDRALALARLLNRETGFAVAPIDLNVLCSCKTPVTEETQAACLMAVGAAMREERVSL